MGTKNKGDGMNTIRAAAHTKIQTGNPRIWLCSALLLLVGCHPFSCLHPTEFPLDVPEEIVSSNETYPKAPVDVRMDHFGIPHIEAESQNDLAYAQGYLHGRDRLWQILLQRAFSTGRLTEIFGNIALDVDRRNRILTYKLKDHVANLSERNMQLVQAYSAGVNDAAERYGRTPEMWILGVNFEVYTPRDALALARLQAWNLSAGMGAELARNRIIQRLAEDDPRRSELLAPTPTFGTPVVKASEHSGSIDYTPTQMTTYSKRAAPPIPKNKGSKGSRQVIHPTMEHLRNMMQYKGASNVWAVHGDKTASGHPILAHDPHLSHSGPGLFHLAHLKTDDYMSAGGSIPGLPGVVLGQGRHIAWGSPVANTDSMDLIRISPYEDRADLYLLDGEPRAYETIEQTFRYGPDDDAASFTETWQVTEFGLVLPPVFDSQMEEDDIFVLKWPGFDPIEDNGNLFTSLWDLAAASNVEEATAALQEFTSPPLSYGLAFSDGTIAYRLSGEIPVRKSDEPIGYPRDGSSSQAGWSGKIPAAYKPQLENPERGFLVAANQRMIESSGPSANFIGIEGASPYRAFRITERLEELLEEKKPTADDIIAIQQDVESVAARNLAGIFSTAIPDFVLGPTPEHVQLLKQELAAFDGSFTIESRAALFYTRLDRTVRQQILQAHFNEDVADQLFGHSFVEMAIHEAIQNEASGSSPALLDNPETSDYDGLAGFMSNAARDALQSLVDDIGDDAEEWTWGKVHTLSFRGALASAPVIGMLFQTQAYPEPGCRTCVRAEQASASRKGAVSAGAVFRIIAEMSETPQVRMVNDSGQSGHFGHRHFADLYPFWSGGLPIKVALEDGEIEKVVEGRARFLPYEKD
jgi:penicillin G amidase